LTLEEWTNRISQNVSKEITTTYSIISQKYAILKSKLCLNFKTAGLNPENTLKHDFPNVGLGPTESHLSDNMTYHSE
jgi:hypothetical protein